MDKIQVHEEYKRKKIIKIYHFQTNFKEKHSSTEKVFSIYKFIIFIISFFSFCNCLSEITLKTKDIGNINILSDTFFNDYKPSEVIINGSPQSINNSYDFYSESITIIKWNININSTKEMFSFCGKIIEIDLSNFDTSQVTDMNSMFFQCRGLILLNLSNFDASQVTDMGYMFSSADKISSLDLSNFNTSQVKNMEYIFFDGPPFISLDLSNFDTSKVTNMGGMFLLCSDLIS